MTKITVDKSLLESVLESHIKVLDTLRDWTNSDDFLWIQYSDEIMQNEALTLRTALAEPVVEPVAARYDFDGYGWRYIDNGSGSDWLERGMNCKDHELMYTAPPPAEVPLLTDEEIRDLFMAHAKNNAHGVPYLTMYIEGGTHLIRQAEQAVRQNAGLK